jgi:hypothetical protein
MRRTSSAILTSAVIVGCAAAPATAETFEISHEIDADLFAALIDDDASALHADLRWRAEAEAVTQSGLRWGAALSLAARSRDGRRGLQAEAGAAPGPAGLVTGLGRAGGGADDAFAGAERADVFVRANLIELYAGLGQTAARSESLSPATALRLGAADGALIDPIGQGLVDTGLTLSAPAARVLVRSRRIAGFALAASYTPQGDVCGPDRCLDPAYGEIDHVASAAISFDRRRSATGARWRAFAGLEVGQSIAGPLSAALSDPWTASFQLAREAGGVSLGVNAISAHDGLENIQYAAVSGRIGIERGDWLFDAQLGRAHADAVRRDGWTAQIAASRLVGPRGVAGLALQIQDQGGAALMAEAGLRF